MKNILKKAVLLSGIALFILVVCCCRSTQLEEKIKYQELRGINVNVDDPEFNLFKNDILFSETENSKFIFFRLYNPYYDNCLCIENILKNCIAVVDVYPSKSSHASIGFDLNDNFYGLTTAGKKDLKIESCTDIFSNDFMKKCNPKKSIQTTYALKVSDEEYYNAKKLVEEYYDDPKTYYNTLQNFAMAVDGVKRKLFLKGSKRELGGVEYKNFEKSFEKGKHDFICSSFVAYVLVNSVDSVRDYFYEKKIDLNYVMPSDIANIPGVVKLFKSEWCDYRLAAKYYSSVYSCLNPYFRENFVMKNSSGDELN